MPLKRKVCNLRNMNDDDKVNQMSFFDPVYNNGGVEISDSDDESEEELLADGIPRFSFRTRNNNDDQSNETLDALPIAAAAVRVEKNDTIDQDPSVDISTAKIMARIQEIHNSLQQARTMLEPMEKFKHLIPGSADQCTKLRSIISNLEEQQGGYVNLLNLIALTAEERAAVVNKYTAPRQMQMSSREHANNVDDDDEEEEEEDDDDDRLSPRRDDELPIRPRIESKIGFTPQPTVPVTPTVPATINSDNEQTNRNDNSNYDSLVGSLKSDTLNWKDEELTSDDETSDVDSEADEKEIARSLMLQKEQLRALQGQKRALLALQRRSEQRLLEQQQRQHSEIKNMNSSAQERDKENRLEASGSNTNVQKLSENDLLCDINGLRDRLKLLRSLYEQKHRAEMQEINSQPKSRPAAENPTAENRLQNLQNVRERLDELEQIVSFYQMELVEPREEETTIFEETSIPPDDVQRLKALMLQRAPLATNEDNAPKQLDKLSDELATKRRELEQAKSALSHLQQMVKRIQPDESSSARSTPVHPSASSTKKNNTTFEQTPAAAEKTSLLSSILSPKPAPNPVQSSSYADAKMAAQHREIERLVESRQRLHTIKHQIASLHESMATPPVTVPTPPERVDRPKKDAAISALQTPSPLVGTRKPAGSYADKLNDSRNLRPPHLFNRSEIVSDDDDEELGRFECESGDGEEIDDDNGSEIDLRSASHRSNSVLSDQRVHNRMKQSNFHAPEDIVAEHERRLLQTNFNLDSTTEIGAQMRQVCNCLSTFIREQKSFNRHIEQHLMAATNAAAAPPPPPPASSQSTTLADPVFSQLQQQVLTQGLIVNLNTAYREIAVLQSEINSLQTENNRLASSITLDNQYQNVPRLFSRDTSKESLYSLGQIRSVRQQQSRSRYDDEPQQQHRLLSASNKFDNTSKTSSFNSQSTGKQTAIHVNRGGVETTPIKHEPKPVHFRSNQISDTYELSNLNHRRSSKESISKSFIIRRRPLSTENQNDVIKSHTIDYDQRRFEPEITQSLSSMEDYRQPTASNQRQTFSDSDEDDEQSSDLPTSSFNIQPLACYSSESHNLDNIDVQTLDLQVKSIMVQLIPFMRLHINEIFDQSILNHIRERILFLFKQQPDSAQLVRNFQNQFSELLGKTIGKYCGTTIRECAVDLIRDISDVSFDELVKYKVFENATNAPSATNRDTATPSDKQIISIVSPIPAKQQDRYSPRFDRHYVQQTSSNDDGENENKYQIELAESERRPLMLIGSDEEDNDSDQEENKYSELETAVSRQQSNPNANEIGNGTTTSTELNSNGHEYVLVNRANDPPQNPDVIPETAVEKDDNENKELTSSP